MSSYCGSTLFNSTLALHWLDTHVHTHTVSLSAVKTMTHRWAPSSLTRQPAPTAPQHPLIPHTLTHTCILVVSTETLVTDLSLVRPRGGIDGEIEWGRMAGKKTRAKWNKMENNWGTAGKRTNYTIPFYTGTRLCVESQCTYSHANTYNTARLCLARMVMTHSLLSRMGLEKYTHRHD